MYIDSLYYFMGWFVWKLSIIDFDKINFESLNVVKMCTQLNLKDFYCEMYATVGGIDWVIAKWALCPHMKYEFERMKYINTKKYVSLKDSFTKTNGTPQLLVGYNPQGLFL